MTLEKSLKILEPKISNPEGRSSKPVLSSLLKQFLWFQDPCFLILLKLQSKELKWKVLVVSL